MISDLFAGTGLLLLVYFILVAVYMAVEGKRRGRISAAAKGVFAAALPGLGLLLLLLYELFGQALGLMKRTGPEEEEEDFSMSFGDHAYDAYYAVSMMTAHMEQLGEDIYALEEAIKRGVDDDALLDKYVEKVREFLLRRYGDSVTREQQRMRYMEMLRLLSERHPDHPAYHAERIRALIRAERLEEAAEACAAFRASLPEAELPLLLTLQIQQAAHEREAMKETIESLKRLPTRLTNEAMQAIRYWEGGAARE